MNESRAAEFQRLACPTSASERHGDSDYEICVVIVTDHSAYDWDFVVAQSALVIDTRNATKHVRGDRERIIRA